MVRSIRPIRSNCSKPCSTPAFEALEGRRLLSGGTETPVPAGLVNGLLVVRGTDANDVIKLSTDGTNFTVTENGVATNYAMGDVKHVIVYGGAGDDDLEVDNTNRQFTLGVVLIGGAGNDTLVGGGGRDYLLGNDGNDVCTGMAGDDTMSGGAGADTMVGGDGADRIDGDDGNDKIGGGSGADNLHGEAGKDSLDGGAGNDKLDGGAGNDHLDGGKGTNHCNGGSGKDQVIFRPGAQTIDHSDANGEHVHVDTTVDTTTTSDHKPTEDSGGTNSGSDKPTDVQTKPPTTNGPGNHDGPGHDTPQK